MDKLPEDYWIGRGADLIGIEILSEKENARQFPTYQAIVQEIWCREFPMVLDVGCNVAALEMFLNMKPWPGVYFGIDTNPHAVKFCSDRGLSVKLGGLRPPFMPAISYDCVVVKDVLEHLESLDPAREAFRVASKAVILSFFMPPTPHESNIQKTDLGYYHNRYDEREVIHTALHLGFMMVKRIDTWERGPIHMNRTYVFVRG